MKNFAYDGIGTELMEEVLRLSKVARKRRLMSETYIVVITELFYEVWSQRCMKMYQAKTPSADVAVRTILFRAATRLPDIAASFLLL